MASSYACVATGTAGLRVVDVFDLAAPTDGDLRIVDVSEPTALVGFYDVPGMPSTPHVAV